MITDYSPTVGAARTLTSSVGTAYVSGTTFDPINRVSARTLGTGAHTITREYSFDPHLRLTGWKATGATTGLLQDDRIARDAVGNVLSRHDARPGVDQFECFGYDTRHRLTSAVTKTGSCTGPAGGPTPYSHTYTYSLDGRVLSRDEGIGPIAYTYPAVGAARPHAVTSVGSDSYTYDPNGQMTARPGDTGSQQLAWDAEHRIGSITETGSTTEMVYDADGTRLVRADPTTTTVYLDGTELSATPTGIAGKRSYTAGNMTVAVRDNTGRVDWLLGDHLGTTTVTVNAATGIGATQRFLPYGKPRTPTTGVTERGWIGQTRDTTTGLQYLNARYYDPNTGRFLSTDPIVDLSENRSLDRYGYGHNNPTTLKDPTGLCIGCAFGAFDPAPIAHAFYQAGIGRKPGAAEAKQAESIMNSYRSANKLADDRYREMLFLAELYGPKPSGSGFPSWLGPLVETVVNFVPLVGDAYDVGLCGSSVFRGSWGDAGMNCGAMVPGIGVLGDSAQQANIARRAIDDLPRPALPRGGANLSQQRLDHIVMRHGHGSQTTGAGHFARGTSGRDLTSMIDDAVRGGSFRPNTQGRPGTIFEHDFGSPIGMNAGGNVSSSLRVVVDPNGNVITAFPY